MSEFRVKYWQVNKPTGARSFIVRATGTSYEDVLFEMALNHLCERNYYHNYEWFMLNEHVFIKRLMANGARCEYEVALYDMKLRSKLITTYRIEIECLFNDKSVELFEEKQERIEPIASGIAKEKQPTDWLIKETRAVRWFLLLLEQYGGLKELKKSGMISKATFYRNLKLCEEKGIIKDGKLTKRLHVSKAVK